MSDAEEFVWPEEEPSLYLQSVAERAMVQLHRQDRCAPVIDSDEDVQ